MKYSLLILLSLLILPVISLPQVAQAGDCQDPVYNREWSGEVTTGAFFRDIACMEGSVIMTTLPVGTKVNVIGETDGWYKIQTADGMVGYVGQWLISVTSTSGFYDFSYVEPDPEPTLYSSASMVDRVRGYILLQVEEHGEAWYIPPDEDYRYYMKDGATAYEMLRAFGLGITDSDLASIPSVGSTSEMDSSSSICSYNSTANRLKGKILLQVEQHGEAWYIDPDICRRIYMRDGEAAYSIMRYLSLGITNADLNKIVSKIFEALPYAATWNH
ncbi:MAG: SH3 domain-containing protein [Patescibacteria group bacterium]